MSGSKAEAPFSADEARRYARHIVLKDVGGAGQQKLRAARVLVVGAGGLGSPVLAYLAAAGVGALTVADHDTVSLSNLQRQVIHTTDGVGTPKAASAERFAMALNPHAAVTAKALRIEAGNAASLVAGHDLVVEGTDSFETRAVLAGACEAARVPLVSGAVSMFDGQVTVLAPHLEDAEGRPAPRFADLHPVAPGPGEAAPCETVGVLGPLTGVIGTLMAMEAVKLILGIGTPLIGRLLVYDGRAARFVELAYRRR